jgi:uncharacterized protein YecE (DUF72 family)
MVQLPPRIGTAGWTVPPRYAGELAGTGSQLERYARRFSAVEINSSFHRPHSRQTYERWAASTPESFRFSVKMPKTITHAARLADCHSLLDRFVSEATGLGTKLGVLLVQLPPKLAFDESLADPFFRDLQSRIDAPVALEPRHASWFAPSMDGWLAERHVARVAADPAKVEAAAEPGGWTGLVYYRLHGSPRMYYSAYDAAALAALSRRLEESRARGIPAWCIFDNTAAGAALGNALELATSLTEAPHNQG